MRQQTDYSCGDAAVESVCRFYGTKKTVPSGLANPIQGLSPDSVTAILRYRGLTVLAGPMTIEDLKHLTKTRPVICPVGLAGGHWLVVRGVTRTQVHFQDPSSGAGSLPIATFHSVWSDTSSAGHQYTNWGICAWLT